MKNRKVFIVLLILIGFSYFMFSYTVKPNTKIKTSVFSDNVEIPSDIQSILDTKCMSCHNSKSKSSKSKMKLNFDKFTNGNYSKGKLISKLGKITKQLSKNKMPPEKFLIKNPDKTLSADESKLIISWATDQRKILAGE